MAKQQPTKAADPKPAAADGPVPYPKTWGKMKPDERQAWMRANRPARPVGAPAAPAKAPATVSAPAPAAPQAASEAGVEGGQLVRIEALRYTVRVGTREPVESTGADLVATVDREMRAWEEQCQGEGEGDGDGTDE